MTDFDPAPDIEAGESRWQGGTDTFRRVYDVTLGLTSPTAYTDVADLADCSPNAAKKHLDRLTEMGIARANREGRPATYERNEGYLEWQDASRIAADLSVEEIVDRVAELEARRSEYETRFDATDPSAVSVFDAAGREAVHERMEAVSDWRRTIRDRRLYELARRLSENDGRLIPA